VNLDSFPTALHELDGRLLLPPVFRMFQHPLRRAKGRENPEIAPHLIQKRKKIVWNSNGKGEKTKGRKKKKTRRN
jgi:hypothetical protein